MALSRARDFRTPRDTTKLRVGVFGSRQCRYRYGTSSESSNSLSDLSDQESETNNSWTSIDVVDPIYSDSKAALAAPRTAIDRPSPATELCVSKLGSAVSPAPTSLLYDPCELLCRSNPCTTFCVSHEIMDTSCGYDHKRDLMCMTMSYALRPGPQINLGKAALTFSTNSFESPSGLI